jgi:ribose transport system substrate-binding protein
MRKLLTAVAVLTIGLSLAGCGSDKSAATSASTGGGGAGLAAARSYLKTVVANPTSIGIDQPLSKRPDTKKLIIGLNSGLPAANILAAGWKQATEDLGWTYKEIVSGTTPEDQQKAMTSALQLNPNGIAIAGIPISTIQTQLEEAKSKGIWANTSATTDKPSGAMYDTSIDGPAMLNEWGKMVAAKVIVKSNGAAKIQFFSLPFAPILLEFDKGFKDTIDKWCPGCELKVTKQQPTDIGTKTPRNVVSALQAAPDTNWVVFALAELGTGVQAAIQGAGIKGVDIGGLSALPENYEALRKDTQDAWTAYALPLVGYRQIDSFARKFNGDPIVDALGPTQLATVDNVNGMVFDKDGNYVAVADYRQQFRKLWHVG